MKTLKEQLNDSLNLTEARDKMPKYDKTQKKLDISQLTQVDIDKYKYIEVTSKNGEADFKGLNFDKCSLLLKAPMDVQNLECTTNLVIDLEKGEMSFTRGKLNLENLVVINDDYDNDVQFYGISDANLTAKNITLVNGDVEDAWMDYLDGETNIEPFKFHTQWLTQFANMDNFIFPFDDDALDNFEYPGSVVLSLDNKMIRQMVNSDEYPSRKLKNTFTMGVIDRLPNDLFVF